MTCGFSAVSRVATPTAVSNSWHFFRTASPSPGSRGPVRWCRAPPALRPTAAVPVVTASGRAERRRARGGLIALARRLGSCYKAGMAAIVGVHGIAQQFKGGYQLGSVWFDALRDGVAAARTRRHAYDGTSRGAGSQDRPTARAGRGAVA